MDCQDLWLTGPASHIAEMMEWQRLAELVAARPEERLLEVGCGSGRHLALLKNRGLDVVGVEKDPNLIEQARRMLSNRHLVQAGQPEDLPFEDNTFDVVILNRSLNYCLSPGRAVAEAARVANRRLVIETINPLSWLGFKLRLAGGDNRPEHMFRSAGLKRLIKESLGPSPVEISSLLIFPQAWLPRLKNLEMAEWASSTGLGGLLFAKVDIRYTHRTRPLPSRAGLARTGSKRHLPAGQAQRTGKRCRHASSFPVSKN